MKKIVCFHLYNDYSGSPKVLATTLNEILQKRNWQIEIVTSDGNGALSEFSNSDKVKFVKYRYTFSDNHLKTFFSYLRVQILTFFAALKYMTDKDAVFYINTLLPTGPAIAGKLTGKKVIYHYHENAGAKGRFYKILSRLMQTVADKIICVSEYQKSFLKKKDKCVVIPNALPHGFVSAFENHPGENFERKTVLMLSSLKTYKGTAEFFKLASMLPEYKFVIVINDEKANIDKYISRQNLRISSNIEIYDRQKDTTIFYKRASVVLNLTDKEKAIETFGLTALEAMTAGLPVIVPTAGGIAEMVEDGIDGYKTDVGELEKICFQIKQMLTDKDLYEKLSKNALLKAGSFDSEKTTDKIICLLEKVYLNLK